MTSPAQLKYLEAMGIPVWVPRELVIETETSEETGFVGSTVTANKIIADLDSAPEKKPAYSNDELHHKNNNSVVVDTTKTKQTASANLIASTSNHSIYACGSLQAAWMVIGESPESIMNHDNQPYAGEIGVLLANMLRAVDIENPRENAYLINVIRASQGQSNNQQSEDELHQLLMESIKSIQPKIIFVVGQLAAQTLLQTKEPLARLRGKTHQLKELDIPLVVSYYPSYLLNKPMDKRKAWEDLKLAMSLLS